MKKQKTIYGSIQKADEETGVYTIVASTGSVDRDNELILPKAFKNLKNYLKTNPVILGFHNYRDWPIGKAVGGKIEDNALLLDIKFAETQQGRDAKYLYDDGFMNTFSVGFMVNKYEYEEGKIQSLLDKNDIKADPLPRIVFTDVELLEVSAVPVPANREAVMMRGIESDAVKTFLHYLQNLEENATIREEPEGREATVASVEEKRNNPKRWFEYR